MFFRKRELAELLKDAMELGELRAYRNDVEKRKHLDDLARLEREWASRQWADEGDPSTGVSSLKLSEGKLLRLPDGRVYFLPSAAMITTSYSVGGYGFPVSNEQKIIPLD